MTRHALRGVLIVASAVWLSTRLFAQSPWTQVSGQGFELRGKIASHTLVSVACDLEKAVQAFGGAGGGIAESARPRVIAIDNARGLREWMPQFNERGRGTPLGAYWQGLYGDHIVIRIDAPRPERLRRVIHEYAHFITHQSRPEPSPWLDEGLSEVWEHAAIAADEIAIGGPVAEHLKRLRSQKNWIPLRDVFAANTIPAYSTSASAMFYAESWALVHYLMFEKRGGVAVAYRTPNSADLPTDAALRAYVLGPMGAALRVSTVAETGQCPREARIREVPALQSLVDRARALADGDHPDSALPVVRAALAMSAENIEAMEVLGFVHFKANRPREAASVFDRAIATGRASHVAYYYRVLLAEPIPDRPGAVGPVPKVEYLRKAVALNPGFAPAVQRLRELTGKY